MTPLSCLVCNPRILTNFKETVERLTWDLNSQLLQQVPLEERVLLLSHLPQSGTAGCPADRDRPCSRITSALLLREEDRDTGHTQTIQESVCTAETETQCEESKRERDFEPVMLHRMLWGTERVLGYPKVKGYGWQLDRVTAVGPFQPK